LGGHYFFVFELTMKEGIRLLQLRDGSLKGVVFCFDFLVLLFEGG
jgi:hypothetical protein